MAGCLVSLSMLSTRLTLLLMVATPALMGVGTLMGSALRKLSRQCQEQVSEFPPAPPCSPPSLHPVLLGHPPHLHPGFLTSGSLAGCQGNGCGR